MGKTTEITRLSGGLRTRRGRRQRKQVMTFVVKNKLAWDFFLWPNPESRTGAPKTPSPNHQDLVWVLVSHNMRVMHATEQVSDCYRAAKCLPESDEPEPECVTCAQVVPGCSASCNNYGMTPQTRDKCSTGTGTAVCNGAEDASVATDRRRVVVFCRE